MSNDEKRSLIDSAETVEEVEEKVQEIEAAEEVKEEPKEEEPLQEEKEEEPKAEEEPKEEITHEEERKLLKDTTDVTEVRNSVEMNIVERKGENKMEELRNSKEYIEAYADYIKTGEDKEMRALITTGGYSTGNSATVEVPDMVYDIVKTAWEREDLMARVRTLSVKGNLKVQFEASAGDATVHQEGNSAVSEESLVLGVVELTPSSIKKWISISDEVVDLRGEAFLRYIYDELTYKIAKKCADELIYKITQLPASLSPNGETGVYDTVSANIIKEAPAIGTIAKAISNLSDETRDITIVMNKLTYGAFKEAQYGANFAADPFEGARVVFNNSLPAYSAANANAVYAIVGDFAVGALANYPNGEGIEIKYDDTTLMTSDLVRILGRRYVAAAPVADKAFCLIGKPASV